MQISRQRRLFFCLSVLMAGSLITSPLWGDELPPMLNLVATGEDPAAIDFSSLPVLQGAHSVVTRGAAPWEFRLHNYLTYFGGQYWCMWSHGPKVEDHPTQQVRYAVSRDGLRWSEDRILTGSSVQDGFRYIARGFWVREGKLLALASHDEAYDEKGRVHFFGKSLELLVFEWNPESEKWEKLGVAFKDAINNFPPRQLATGEWAMTRRDHENNVSLLIGGVKSPLDWQAFEIFRRDNANTKFRPDEPEWWLLADGRALGVIRDNGRSKRLFRTISADHGRTWTTPEPTNFPDATSKFFALKSSLGLYVLVSNANPQGRDPLCLSVSRDGMTFTQMASLPVPPLLDLKPGRRNTYQYPHVIEHDGSLLIAYSRNKRAIETIKISLEEIRRLVGEGSR